LTRRYSLTDTKLPEFQESTAINQDAKLNAAIPGAVRRGRIAVAIQIALGLLLFFVVDGVVFSRQVYFPWVAPISSLGTAAQALDGIERIPAGKNTVLVMGSSKMGEGFSAKLADAEAASTGSRFRFANGAVAGTTARVWYYMLRQMRDPAGRLAAVVIIADTYHDNDADLQADRQVDIPYLPPLLGLSDMIDFPGSFNSWAARQEAAEAILLKGLFYKNDLQAFLLNARQRVHDVLAWRRSGFSWVADYAGRDDSLAGLEFDMASGKLSERPGSKPIQTGALASYAEQLRQTNGRPPDNAATAPYRTTWIGRIADFCRDNGIKLFVFRVPRGPLHYFVPDDAQPTGVLAEMGQQGRLTLLPATTFNHLERPEYFFDDLHLNSTGRKLLSVELAAAILQRLPASR
jgi:hypothetical protein